MLLVLLATSLDELIQLDAMLKTVDALAILLIAISAGGMAFIKWQAFGWQRITGVLVCAAVFLSASVQLMILLEDRALYTPFHRVIFDSALASSLFYFALRLEQIAKPAILKRQQEVYRARAASQR